jgi:hypothetical protein
MCYAGSENKNSHWHKPMARRNLCIVVMFARKQKHPHEGVLVIGYDSRYFQQVNDLVLVLPSG